MTRRRLGAPLLVASLILVSGCAGHSGGSRAHGRGKAAIRVLWPDRNRLIPNAANSIKVTLSQNGTVVKTQTIARPATGATQSEADFDDLPYGQMDVSIQAFPSTDATGVAQASGAGVLSVTSGPATPITVSLASTVATLSISPATAHLAPGGTLLLNAIAKDASNNIVLLAANGGQEVLNWSVSGTGSVTLAGTGPTVTLTGGNTGPVTVTAQFTTTDGGATVTATASLQVVDTTAYQLETAGFPKSHGDAGDTGRSTGVGAAGSVGWSASVGSAAVSTIVVGPDGTVYAASGSQVSAVDATGAVKWNVTLAGTVRGLALTKGNGLYVGATKLTSLDPATGAALWDYTPPSGTPYEPNVGADGTIYLGTTTSIYALSPSDRSVVWSAAFPGNLGGVALGSDGTVVARAKTTLRSYDGATGAVKSTRTLASTYTATSFGPPSVAGTTAYFESDTYTVTTVCIGGTRRTSYGYSRSAIAAASGSLATNSWSGTISSSTGTTVPATYGQLAGAGVSPDGHFLRSVNGSSTTVKAYSGAGTANYSLSVPASDGASWATDGTGYLATGESPGRVVSFASGTGTTGWTATLPSQGSGCTPAVGPDGTVYAGTSDGHVIQIH